MNTSNVANDAIGHACLRAWDLSNFTGECDAVHPMYVAAFESGYQAAIAQPLAGLVTVPAVPTDKMVQAALHLDLSYMPGQEGVDRAAVYRAMILAAPKTKLMGWNAGNTAAPGDFSEEIAALPAEDASDMRLTFPNPIDIFSAMPEQAKRRTSAENVADVLHALAAAGMRNCPTVDAEPSKDQVLAITTAYEQGVGKGHQAHETGNEIGNPYTNGWNCDHAWSLGYEEGKEQAKRKAQPVPQSGDVATNDDWHAPGLGEVHNGDHTRMIYCVNADDVADNALAGLVRDAMNGLKTAPAVGVGSGDAQLFKFYGVSTDAELIAAQSAHIERLQAKLQQTSSLAPQQVREG